MLVLVCTLLTAVVFAHAQNAVVTIEEVNNVGVDNYIFRYKTSDGTEREEEGKFVGDIWTVTGRFVWIGPDGVTYSTQFIADDKGYRVLPGGGLQQGFYSGAGGGGSGFGGAIGGGIGGGTVAGLLGIGK